jgi:hypothetical protein
MRAPILQANEELARTSTELQDEYEVDWLKTQ